MGSSAWITYEVSGECQVCADSRTSTDYQRHDASTGYNDTECYGVSTPGNCHRHGSVTGCSHQGITDAIADDDTECCRVCAPRSCYGQGCVTGCSHQGIDDECCSASVSEAIWSST